MSGIADVVIMASCLPLSSFPTVSKSLQSNTVTAWTLKKHLQKGQCHFLFRWSKWQYTLVSDIKTLSIPFEKDKMQRQGQQCGTQNFKSLKKVFLTMCQKINLTSRFCCQFQKTLQI